MEKAICINVSFQVTMSYLQIYQEKIYDLLNSSSKIELSLREHPVKGEDIYVTYTWLYVQVRLSLGVTKLRDNKVKDYRDTVYLGKNLMYGVREKYGPWHTYGVRRAKPDMLRLRNGVRLVFASFKDGNRKTEKQIELFSDNLWWRYKLLNLK